MDRRHALDSGGGKAAQSNSAGSGRLRAGSRIRSTPAYNLVNIYPGYQPVPNVVAAVSVENLLNVDYTKYMCCSTAAGYVVPSPGITFKGSLTVRYGVKGDS